MGSEVPFTSLPCREPVLELWVGCRFSDEFVHPSLPARGQRLEPKLDHGVPDVPFEAKAYPEGVPVESFKEFNMAFQKHGVICGRQVLNP